MSNDKVVNTPMETESKRENTVLLSSSSAKGTSSNDHTDENNSLAKTLSTELNAKHDLKFRENLYRLIISQLFYDGYQNIAVGLSGSIQASPPCPPSNRLLNLIKVAIKNGKNFSLQELNEDDNDVGSFQTGGLDFDYESDKTPTTPDASLYETCYVTSHKAPCRAAAFDHQGTVIATGSVDASIKILDVERMIAKSTFLDGSNFSDQQQSAENHPVIRTLYDHADEITTLAFHPFEPILASGSRDFTVKFFEYAKPSTKKAFKHIQEAEQIRSICFHPNGDWLLVGTNNPTLRLYKVETSQCFISSNPGDHHKGAITSVEWSPNARVFATGSKDGSIKIWDSVSNKCINTFSDAHSHLEVCSVTFTRNSKYLLSSGKDSVVRLWELSTARCLIAYTGAGSAGKQEKRTQAIFNHSEDYIFYPDEKTTALCCWDSRNAERQKLLSLGHNGPIKAIVHSPIAPHFVSCSDDYRARFWRKKASILEV